MSPVVPARGRYLGGAVLALLATSCRLPGGGSATEAVEQREGQLDFSTGDVQGTISWNASPVGADEAKGLLLYEPNGLALHPDAAGYAAQNVSQGAHTLGVFAYDKNANCVPANVTSAHTLGETSFVVSAGSVTTANVDLTASAGRVAGVVTVNGVPLPGAWIVLDLPCVTLVADGSGAFAGLLPPRSYSAGVYSSSGRLGSLAFTVTAGETIDVGAVDLAAGNVQGLILWNGAPVSTQDRGWENSWYQPYAFESDALAFRPVNGGYSAPNVAPGAHTVGLFLFSLGCGYGDPTQVAATNRLGETSFTVTAGSTTTADFDLSQTAGRVTGSIAINGVPSPVNIDLGIPCAGINTDEVGAFSRVLPPGPYVAQILGSSGLAGSFSFTVVAGIGDQRRRDRPATGWRRRDGVVEWGSDQPDGVLRGRERSVGLRAGPGELPGPRQQLLGDERHARQSHGRPLHQQLSRQTPPSSGRSAPSPRSQHRPRRPTST